MNLKRSLRIHVAAFLLTNLLLLTINLLFTPSLLWFFIPLFGWFAALSLHAVVCVTWRMSSTGVRWLLVHLTVFLTVNLFLIIIDDLASGSITWSYYPLLGWLVFLSLHAVSHALSARTVESIGTKLLILHVFSYLTVNLLLMTINFLTSGILSWSYFPLIFWGLGLLAHGVFQKLVTGDSREKQAAQKNPLPLKNGKKQGFLARQGTKEAKSEGKPKLSRSLPSSPKESSLEKKPLKQGGIDSSAPLTEEERKELARTESEMDVNTQEAKCIVHKGSVDGTVYICPACKAYYCLKCAKHLKVNGESCWSCGRELNP